MTGGLEAEEGLISERLVRWWLAGKVKKIESYPPRDSPFLN
jgi:hypothetical protein